MIDMDNDIFDETYMDTLKRGLSWFATHGEFDKTGNMKVKLNINGKDKEYEIKEVN
jgi:hypothetical protein